MFNEQDFSYSPYILFQEPLQLYGEGDYSLANVKQMYGTEGFLSLADEVKKCQNEKTVLECKAKAYLDRGKKNCECVPHHLRSFSPKVTHQIGYQTNFDFQKTFCSKSFS